MREKETIIVCSSYNTTVGDHYIGLLNMLVTDFGWKAVFLSDTDVPQQFSETGIQYILWPGKSAKSIKSIFFFSSLLLKTRPKIALSNFSSSFICTLLARVFRVERVLNHYHTPVAQLRSDWGKLKNFNVKLRQRVLKFNSEIIASSTFVKNDLTDFWKIDDKKILVIPFLLDGEGLRNKAQEHSETRKNVDLSQKITFFYPGRIHNSKGHIEFIKNIFIPLYEVNKNVVLIINGVGPLYDTVKQVVSKNNLEEVVVFQNPTSYSEYLYNIKNSTFCCGLSSVEGFGLVFLEMMALGAIPITRDISPMNEFIPADRGILLKNQNYQDVINKLLSLIMEKEKYHEARKNILTHFNLNYDVRSQGKEFAQLIKGNNCL